MLNNLKQTEEIVLIFHYVFSKLIIVYHVKVYNCKYFSNYNKLNTNKYKNKHPSTNYTFHKLLYFR